MSQAPDEVAFHFHLDRKMLDRFGTFHFHLHTDETTASAIPVPQSRSPQGTPPKIATRPTQTFTDAEPIIEWPPNDQVDVVDGKICALVRAIPSTGSVEWVKAWVYSGSCPDESQLASPHPSAVAAWPVQLGTVLSFPDANFAFLEKFGNLVPQAGSDASGASPNCLVVWAKYSDSLYPLHTTRNFRGLTAVSADCPTHSSGELIVGVAKSVAKRPESIRRATEWPVSRTVRVTVDPCSEAPVKGTTLEGAFAALARQADAGPIYLNYEANKSAAATSEWIKRCPRRGDWSLRVTQFGDSCHAVLRCLALDGAPLPSVMIWKSNFWSPHAEVRMEPAAPISVAKLLPGCVIGPA